MTDTPDLAGRRPDLIIVDDPFVGDPITAVSTPAPGELAAMLFDLVSTMPATEPRDRDLWMEAARSLVLRRFGASAAVHAEDLTLAERVLAYEMHHVGLLTAGVVEDSRSPTTARGGRRRGVWFVLTPRGVSELANPPAPERP